MTRLRMLLSAAWYKEWRALVARGLLGGLLFAFVLPAFIWARSSAPGFQPEESFFWAACSLLFSPAVAMLSNLRFWEERGQGTLESFLALPYGVRSLFLSKLVLPIALGTAASTLFATLCLLRGIALGMNPSWVIAFVAITSVGGIVMATEFAVLVGYAMWMMSETTAKWAQLSIMAFYGGALALPAVGRSFPLSVLVLLVVVTVAVLALLCLTALRRLRVERIVLRG